MKLEKFIRDFSLRAIAFLVTLIMLWSVVLFVGVSFNWTFLTNQIETMFILSGFISGLLIFSLTVANVTSSLTIISMAQNKVSYDSKKIMKQIGFMLVGSSGFIALLLGGLWFAQLQVYQKVSEDALRKVQTISEKKQFSELAKKIEENGKISDILDIRDALAYDVGSEGKVSFLIPRDIAGVKVYYSITPWLTDSEEKSNFSDLDLNKFKPHRREKEEFNKLAKGEIDSFKVPVRDDTLRVFLSKKIGNQEIVILLDTSRKLNDYRGSYK